MNEAFNNGYNIGYAKAHEEWKAEAESVTLLLKEVAKLAVERDAAIADLCRVANCLVCKYNDDEYVRNGFCRECAKKHGGNFKWRGLSLTEKTSDKEEKHE